MAQVKLTKNAMRDEQVKLAQLEKYLPTLQLKKAMLQVEVNNATTILDEAYARTMRQKEELEAMSYLLGHEKAYQVLEALKIGNIELDYENIAGAEIPIFQGVTFHKVDYSLLMTPVWFDAWVGQGQALVRSVEECKVLRERKELLEKELREVSIRVNLFEKVMIPRVKANIKKIKIFMGDQDLAAIAQAKAAKRKIIERKAKRQDQREA